MWPNKVNILLYVSQALNLCLASPFVSARGANTPEPERGCNVDVVKDGGTANVLEWPSMQQRMKTTHVKHVNFRP